MSTYKFEAEGKKLDWVLCEANGLSGTTLAHFQGKFGGGVDLVVINTLYGTKYSFTLKLSGDQIKEFLAQGVKEMQRVSVAQSSSPVSCDNVIPMKKRP